MNDMVVIESLRKSFGDAEILTGIDLTVRRGRGHRHRGRLGFGEKHMPALH